MLSPCASRIRFERQLQVAMFSTENPGTTGSEETLPATEEEMD